MIANLFANFLAGGGRLAFWMLIPAAILATGLAVVRLRRVHTQDRPARHRAVIDSVLDAAIAWTLVAIGVASLHGFATGGPPTRIHLIPLEEILRATDDATGGGISLIIGNLLLYAPTGALVALRMPAWHLGQIAGAAAALSGLIELTQWLFVPGRVASVDDVLLNVTGACLGALAAGSLARLGAAWWRQRRSA